MDLSRVVNRAVNPLLRDLPPKIVTIRPDQVRATLETMAALEASDVVVLDAPTGSGKTVIAEIVRLLRQQRGLYLCHSKQLQDQFADDFGYARVVKGRSNYPTQNGGRRVTCDDCTWTSDRPACAWCDDKKLCPYEVAKMRALRADVAVLNSSYALTEWNGPGRFSGREFVVVDEADTFEKVVQSHISVYVSARRMARYRWEPPSKVTVAACWEEWLDAHLERCEEAAKEEEGSEDAKELKRLERLAGGMRIVRDALRDGLPYAFTGRNGAVEFKPVIVAEYCQENVWRHGKKWLLMSATVVSSSAMLRGLGWPGRYETVRMDSTFPVERRPVVVKPVANMKRSASDGDKRRLAAAIHGEVESEPGRVLVHTVSYDLAGYVAGYLRDRARRPVVTYRMAGERAAAISEYKRAGRCVLVACSADRGVDLPDDYCRLVVIAKVPFPNLGDRMVSMRLHMRDGQTWYTVETVRSVVQMAGRGVRHREDYCKTVILDSQFRDGLWPRAGVLFPVWFRQAITWSQPSAPSV